LARLSFISQLKISEIICFSFQSKTIVVFFSQIISTIESIIKSRLSSFFIFSKPNSISSFLHNPYHGFVVSNVQIPAFVQLKSNSL
jgi:hypothetical protein